MNELSEVFKMLGRKSRGRKSLLSGFMSGNMKYGVLFFGILVMGLFYTGVGFETFAVGEEFSVNAGLMQITYGESVWTPEIEDPYYVNFYGVDMVEADFDASPINPGNVNDDVATFVSSVYCTGSYNEYGNLVFNIVPYSEVSTADGRNQRSYKLAFEADFSTYSQLTSFGDTLIWDYEYDAGIMSQNLYSLGLLDYAPGGAIDTRLSWLFSLSKLDPSTMNSIVSVGVTSDSGIGYYKVAGTEIPFVDSAGMKATLSAYYGPYYGFSLGDGSISTTINTPVISNEEYDIQFTWDINLKPLLVLGADEFDVPTTWKDVKTGFKQEIIIDMTVVTESISVVGDPEPPTIILPETLGLIVGEANYMNVDASSTNPNTYTVYKQEFGDERDIEIVLDDNSLWIVPTEWDGSSFVIDLNALLEGKYVLTVLVDDLYGNVVQRSSYVYITPGDDSHVSTTADRVSTINDGVVSGYIPRSRGGLLGTLQDNMLYVVIVIVGVGIVGGIIYYYYVLKGKGSKKSFTSITT